MKRIIGGMLVGIPLLLLVGLTLTANGLMAIVMLAVPIALAASVIVGLNLLASR